MGDMVVLVVMIALAIVVAPLTAVLLADGVFEVATGRPGFLPFERLLQRRVPATEVDCVRHGAARILQSLGLAFLVVPSLVNGVKVAGELGGAGSAAPRGPDILAFALTLAALVAAMAWLIGAFVIVLRVRYVPIDGESAQLQP